VSPALSTSVQLVSMWLTCGHLLVAWSSSVSPVIWPRVDPVTFSSFTSSQHSICSSLMMMRWQKTLTKRQRNVYKPGVSRRTGGRVHAVQWGWQHHRDTWSVPDWTAVVDQSQSANRQSAACSSRRFVALIHTSLCIYVSFLCYYRIIHSICSTKRRNIRGGPKNRTVFEIR